MTLPESMKHPFILVGSLVLLVTLALGLVFAICLGGPDGIQTAVGSDDRDAVQRFLDEGGDLNKLLKISPKERMTLLQLAILRGHLQFVEFLLAKGAGVNVVDKEGRSPAMHAIAMSSAPDDIRLEILRLLVKCHADIELKDKDGVNALMWAVGYNQLEMVRLLLESRADPNSANRDGYSPIHFAPTTEIASLLLAAGANPELKTRDGKTAADVAQQSHRSDVYNLLKSAEGQRK